MAYIRGYLFRMTNSLHIGNGVRILRGASIRFYKGSDAYISANVKIDENAVIAVQNNGFLRIGEGVGIGPNNYIVCHKHVTIGDKTIFGPNVLVYDHDHIFSAENGVDIHNYTYDDVVIGSNCWIGANTVILKGTQLGDNSVVAAGSVIKGAYPASSIIIQKRETVVKNIKD